MRLTVQFTVQWGQISFDRRTIELTKTKNGSRRTVHLNDDAIKSMKRPGQENTDVVFPNDAPDFVTDSWFHGCMKEAEIVDYLWHCECVSFWF